MKIKDGFLLREIAGSWVVVPIGQRVVEFNGLLNLNESGALVWRKLVNQAADVQSLVDALRDEYEVEEATAKSDIQELIDFMKQKGLIEE
jgi:hypothetical protein